MSIGTKPPRSLEHTRSDLERLAADLRILAEQADRGIESLDRIAEAELSIKRWTPAAAMFGIVILVGYVIIRPHRR